MGALSPVRPDVIECSRPDNVRMKGLVGKRFEASRLNRLRNQDEYNLLWPFKEHCPVTREGKPPHPEITRGDWQAEFLGTYVSAATLSAWNASDDELRNKIDKMIRELIATQTEDGYIGSYDEKDRWKSWDLFHEAHVIIGLLSHYWYTGSKESLNASIRVADRVLKDFGRRKRSVQTTGPHGGMASSGILEPIIWLYWKTGDKRYLEFGRWLVDEDWETPSGPAISSSLLAGRGVAGVGNAKAAEMLICLTGLAEFYRATGHERYLKPILIAWDDIVRHHLYITGSASTGEHFKKDYVLRNDGVFRLGETCVTMTWMYLNLSLGRLTGEARFFDMVEQVLYNHLLGAQSPDGRGWAYYMGLRDSKRYRRYTDPDCCPHRGERAVAVMPRHVFGVDKNGIVVNFYEPSEATLTLQSGLRVNVDQMSDYPFDGAVSLKIDPKKPSHFAVRLRLPGWCNIWNLSLNGVSQEASVDSKGYLVVDRVWARGDLLEMKMEMPVRVVIDDLGNNQRVALVRGPLVYAADSSYLPEGHLLDDVVLLIDAMEPSKNIRIIKNKDSDTIHLIVSMVSVKPQEGAGVWKEKERYYEMAACNGAKTVSDIELVPFFEAGNRDPSCYREGPSLNVEPVTNITYQIWLPYACS